MFKKLFLGLGTLATIAAPIASTISCSTAIPISVEFGYIEDDADGGVLHGKWTITVSQNSYITENGTLKYKFTGESAIDKEQTAVLAIAREMLLIVADLETTTPPLQQWRIKTGEYEANIRDSSGNDTAVKNEHLEAVKVSVSSFATQYDAATKAGDTKLQNELKETYFWEIADSIAKLLYTIELVKY